MLMKREHGICRSGVENRSLNSNGRRMPDITSLQNPHVKDAAKLRDRRHREKQRRILIDGAREIQRAIAAGVQMTEVFVCQACCRSDAARQVQASLPACGAAIYSVTEPVFEKLAYGDRSEGVIGVADMPEATLNRVNLPANPLVVVLESVEKPGNVGAVLRSADAAGVSALVLADARTDLYNPNAIRASLGTIFSVAVASATTQETVDWLRQQGLTIYAARVEGALLYSDADYRGPTAIVLGSEAHGLSASWSRDDATGIHLPMHGAADSLNVSATAAVLVYEALRQRYRASGNAKNSP
jgi:RNA methyltransferase, TrmH family